MKKSLMLSLLSLAFGSAHAGYVIVPTMTTTTTVPGVCTVNFDGSSCPGVSYVATDGQNHVVIGDSPGQYAAPTNDNTFYLTVGGNFSDVRVLLPSANYFGFYAGSVDSYNSVTFFNGSTSQLVLSGDQINMAVTGGNANQGTNAYFNIFTTFMFDSVLLSSSQAAFETDNHSFGIAAAPIPEPGSVALLGLGALSLLAARRRRG